MDTVLIVDDETNYLALLDTILAEEGFTVLTAQSGQAALSILEDSDVDLLITDMKMPEMNGLTLLDTVRAGWPDIPVILMTAHGSVEKAVEAMQKGAFTYIQKPFESNRLLIFVNKALNHARVVQENKRLRHVITSQFSFGNIIGKSRPMQELLAMMAKVSPTSANVLIEGESGTGKELIARSIHFNSPRRDRPFIAVNCSALSESLLESELFGHEKGAFTGAASMKKGRFELADMGTLFLDEIGDLCLNLQVKLLRVIQERVFERVGGTSPVTVNFRLIAATNKNLKEEVRAGRFREDLYYRLNVVYLKVPPLRDRAEDIHLLAHHFFHKVSQDLPADRHIRGIAPECERILLESPWPGNIRQLENTIERAMILCTGDSIRPGDLPRDIFDPEPESPFAPTITLDKGLHETLVAMEKAMIVHALKKAGGIQAHAAARLKIGKSGLNQKLKKYGISAKDLNT